MRRSEGRPGPDGRGGPAGTGAELTLSGVTKRFGGFTAVDQLDLVVEPGEFITLLGPSGSGKTTILNVVAGFLDPDEGHVLVDGEPIDRRPPHKRDFGVVFQNYALFPRMSVYDNVAFPLRMRGVGRDECDRRVMDVLELLRLPEQARKVPAQLSGGQQQRVAVARAVVFEPRVVLMDEPLSALDRKLREALQIELKELHRTIGATVIYVTHDQGEALTMSDRIAVMRSGRIVQVGRPMEIYDRPADGFVATFIGEANRMPGSVADVRDGVLHVSTDAGVDVRVRGDGLSLEVGDAVVASIRPERIKLAGADQATSADVVGRVKRLLYVGNTTRYWVAIGEAAELQVWVQNTGEQPDWAEGEEVRASWDPTSVRILQERKEP